MFPASVDNIQEMVNDYIFRCIPMMLQGIIYSLMDTGITYDIYSCNAPCQMWGMGEIYSP